MEELTYKAIMNDRDNFDLFLLGDNLKAQVKSIEKIDTAGAQVLVGLLQQQKIEASDLSEAVQAELAFLGVV